MSGHLGGGGTGSQTTRVLPSKVPVASAIHALTVGAIGCTTLGMMARVSLGHSGRPLVVRPAVALAFGAVTLAAIIRVLGPLSMSTYSIALYISATLWSLGFATFTIVYAPIQVRPRIDGRAG